MKNIRIILVFISILVIISISAGTVSATNDTTAPHVSDFNPDNNEDNVVGNKLIRVTFTEPMQAGTEWVELKDASNGASISTTKALNGNVLTISHTTLLTHGKTYNLLLHTGCYNDLAGNQLVSTSSSFTIENKVPVVSDFNPYNTEDNVVGNKLIRVTFNETMQTGNEWVELKDASNGASISTTKALNGNVLTISHDTLLTHDKTYNLILHTGCYNDLAGNQLVGISSSFKIENAAPLIYSMDPVNGAPNVTADKVITVTFNEAMQTGTGYVELNDANGNPIPITKSLGSTILTITPNDYLNHGSYNLIFHTGCYNDLASNNLVLIGKSFTVENATPSIYSMDPVNGASNVTADKVITVTFSEAMQTGTGYVELNDANGNPIPITKSLGSTILTITPNDYLNHGSYNLIFHTGCYNDLASNNLVLIGKSFTVESTSPNISSIDPTNYSTNVAVNKVIILNFNEPIKTGNNLTELKGNDGSSVATTNIINGNVLTLTPNTLLTHGRIYTVFLYNGSYTDLAGNPIISCNYSFSVENLILNINTNNTYSNIQDAINAASAHDTIQLFTGSYIENIVINKTLTLMPVSGGNVTIHPLNPSNPIITVNSLGSSTIIQGFNINGATDTGSAGIYLFGASNCKIMGNILTDNDAGIVLNETSNNIAILNNSITNNSIYGIRINDSTNATVTGNIITGNFYGINTQGNSSATIQFNMITGNGAWGIVNQDTSTVNATNNWWGSNYPVVNLVAPSDICIQGGTVTYNPWLVLNVTAKHTSSGDYEITADLTQNNNENNTSSSGNIPNDIPINFSTTYGTIGNTSYTRKGKAILILNSNIAGLANVTATLNNQNITKTVYLGAVYNINTQKGFNDIQAAINDSSTSTNDTIEIYNKTYNENITLNKRVNIVSAADANPLIIGAVNINSGGNGSIIQGLTINGNINLQANNCSIYGNTIIGNGTSGIIASNSFNNTVAYNTITCNGFNGIQSNSSSNSIYGNTIHDCESGIYSENSNGNISSNNLYDNNYGIWTYNSTDIIKFNRITDNSYGLRNDIGTINATNNWWGTNNPTSPSDIWIVSGNVTYNPWLVLNVNPSSTNSGGNTSVTADLTHNNQGEDTTPQGHVPNGIPVNFTTDFGTILSSSYTVKGRATTILNLGSSQTATVTATAYLDNQNISTTGVISTGTAILTINSTAIDNSTEQILNTTYTIPLNNSVTWLSVLWINTGMFTDELQIIVDGIVVQDKYFSNTAYTTWQNSYTISVFNAIKYVNQHLPFIGSAELTTFWNNLTITYNLTSEELTFIQNHSQEFIDNLTVNIVYSGVPGLNLTVTDPNSNVINLNFPGNVIQRTSQVIYSGSPGEGVKSFAIATTDVTNDVLQYWWNQYSSYQNGDAMNVAYNTFLTALIVEYGHDQIADNIATPLNVTWSRTNPIIVSVGEDPFQIYVTLECDHSMGMTVIGQPEDVYAFNYITSINISNIEYIVMNCAYDLIFSSVTTDLLYLYYNYNTYVETFEEDGFIIVKSILNDNFLVLDPETGMVRDIDTFNNFYGGTSSSFYKESTTQISYITQIGYIYNTYQISNPWDLGTSSFIWDGKGSVFISGNGMFLTDIMADNMLAITGPEGSKTLVGTQAALDITDILNKYAGLQILHLVLTDTDGGLIATSPLYIVQKTIERQDSDLPPLFPFPALTLTPLPWNGTNPPYDPFDYPSSEIPINYDDINNFFKEHKPTSGQINGAAGAIGAAIVIGLITLITGGAATG